MKQGSREILLTQPMSEKKEQTSVNIFTNSELNSKYFDVAFTGEPVQCVQADGTCDALKRDYRFAPNMNYEQANEYRYVMDVCLDSFALETVLMCRLARHPLGVIYRSTAMVGVAGSIA